MKKSSLHGPKLRMCFAGIYVNKRKQSNGGKRDTNLEGDTIEREARCQVICQKAQLGRIAVTQRRSQVTNEP